MIKFALGAIGTLIGLGLYKRLSRPDPKLDPEMERYLYVDSQWPAPKSGRLWR